VTPYYQHAGIQIWHGKAEDVLPTLSGVTAIVTDPPAGIAFMGKEWDHDKGGRDAWITWMTDIAAKAIETLPPGGMALVWALPRTSHWTATAWEDAGWECRDVITHHFGSGFPKSLSIGKAIDKAAGAEREVIGTKKTKDIRRNVEKDREAGLTNGQPKFGTGSPTVYMDHKITAPSTDAAKQWEGYGTALKPSTEFWHVFQKPLDGTYAQNALKHGVAGINVDGCRIGTESTVVQRAGPSADLGYHGNGSMPSKTGSESGRWPSNLILSGDDVAELFPVTNQNGSGKPTIKKRERNKGWCNASPGDGVDAIDNYGDSGSASRFFQRCDYRDPIDEASRIIYTAKASGTDRGNRAEKQLPLFGEVEEEVINRHPTVKALTLCEYLVKLVTMPEGTVILDMFGGSGSIAVSCKRLGVSCIMIEQDEAHCKIAAERLEATR